ncbi:ribosomal protein L25, Ctc-form [Halobacteroides halobius DSM 5150]|uniref:Large ribosomal subunit protein bL25 n=1 Tax=Halobacteroides halobius (strain ATCC 35273 / DSM 5150 / MD-1) TaxID=748449 RepID=L0K6F5_HALHC|nr:50S ribosomal protein L25 [Halobacteroides halobius]AGB40120.1 ribosomal protein L25, Ctc-form [Halobacteroides halobius DSM 5150]
MERLQLDAEIREKTGSGVARRLRENGLVPGVLYGKDRESVSVKLNEKKVNKVIGGNQIIDLELNDGTTQPVMVKDVQRDVIKGNLVHVDLHHISLDEPVTIEVRVELDGPAAGQQEGGVLEQLLRKLEVECLPADIPDKVVVDVSELKIGQSLSVDDIELEDELEIVSSPQETIATVVLPDELDLDEPGEETEEEELEEPEVIGEEDEDEELEEELEE